MVCRVKFLAAIMLFICCSITRSAPVANDDVNFACNVDCTAIKTDLHLKIANIFLPTKQQAEQLRMAIESTFQNMSQPDSTTQITPTTQITTTTRKAVRGDLDNVSCGADRECVMNWECKNQHGNNEIIFRNAASENTSGCMETCCHISDKISTAYSDSLENEEMAECGTRHATGVGKTLESAPNQEAEIGEFPWMVAIMLRNATSLDYIGGGSILSPTVVLTAAHKVEKQSAQQLVVRAGEWNMKSQQELYRSVDLDVSEIVIHNKYSTTNNTNNIALLVLSTRLRPRPHISPICLPSEGQIFDNSRCIVTGWGKKTSDSSHYQSILKEITVPVVPRSDCLAKLHRFKDAVYRLDMSYICAGGEQGIDSCHGDGGAPLVCPVPGDPNRYVQAGIVAYSIGCGMKNVPAAYTNVAHLMPWVSEQLDRLGVNKKYYTL